MVETTTAANPITSILAPTPPAATTLTVPDPLNLSSDWWNYFAVTHPEDIKELPQRYATFATQLAAALATLADAERGDVDTMRGNIERHFGRYLRTLQTPAPPAPSANPPKDSYTLDAVLDLGRDGDQLKRTANLEAQEYKLLERSLAHAEERLDAAKLRYRDLPVGAPQRLMAGVRIIRDRLRIETLNLELHWRHAHQIALTQEIEQHEVEFAAARARIEANDSAIEQWQALEKGARKDAEIARADLLKLQLNNSIALASNDDERAQQRQHDAKSLRRTVEIAQADARRVTAVLAQRLLQRVATANATEPDSDRAVLHAQQATLDDQNAAVSEQGARLAQLRSAVAVEAAASDAPAITGTYVKARAEIGTIEAGLEELKAQLRSGAQLADLLDQRLREREGRLGQSIRMLQEAFTDSWGEAHTLLARPLFDINDTPVTFLGLIRVGLILTAAWWLSVLLRGGLLRLGQRNSAFSPASLYAVGRVLHYLLLSL